MSLLDMFKYKQYQSEMRGLRLENSRLGDDLKLCKDENTRKDLLVSKQAEELSSMRKKIDDLENVVHTHIPFFDVNLIANANTFEAMQELWANCWKHINHNSTHQLDRQMRACQANYTPLEISTDTGIAHFRGFDKEHVTSLTKCTCEDFQRHLEPCKHMYRLAYEFNVFMLDDVQYVPEPNKILYYQDLIRIKSNLSDAALDVLGYFRSCNVLVEKKSTVKQLLSYNLIQVSSDKKVLLEDLKRDELFSLLPTDCPLKKTARKAEVIETILTSYTEIIMHLEKLTIPIELTPYVSHLRYYL